MSFEDVDLDEVFSEDRTYENHVIEDGAEDANLNVDQPEPECFETVDIDQPTDELEVSRIEQTEEVFDDSDKRGNYITKVERSSSPADSHKNARSFPPDDHASDVAREKEVLHTTQDELEETLHADIGSDPNAPIAKDGDVGESVEGWSLISNEAVDDQSAVPSETQSASSDSSSDSDDWDMDAEIAKCTADTVDMVSRRESRVEAAKEIDNNSGNTAGAKISNTELTLEHQHNSGIDEPSEIVLSKQEERPWLRNALSDGALLPIGGYEDDDIYRRDIRFYHTGRGDLSRHTSSDPKAKGKPSLLSEDGTLARLHNQLSQEREHRLQIADNFNIVEGELRAATVELEEDQQEIGMLKHAVETREKALKQYKDTAKAWQKHSEQHEMLEMQWKKAFDDQRPLADAERERRILIQEKYEFQQDAGTQTSPIGISSQNRTEKIPSTNAATQTDVDAPDSKSLVDLAHERDNLRSENDKLSARVEKLTKLLNDNREWIEARDWELKGDTGKASPTAEIPTTEDLANLEREKCILQAENNNLSSERQRHVKLLADIKEFAETQEWKPKSETVKAIPSADCRLKFRAMVSDNGRSSSIATVRKMYSEIKLPSTSKAMGWPEHWTEREEEIRKSASWHRARDTAAAEVDAWTKQICAAANTSVALHA